MEGEVSPEYAADGGGLSHEDTRDRHQPEQLLEEQQVVPALGDKAMRVEDEEGAPDHTEVKTDGAEVASKELCETLHHAQSGAHTLIHVRVYQKPNGQKLVNPSQEPWKGLLKAN